MSTDNTSQNEVVIACNLNAIPADQLDEHEQIVRQIFSMSQEVKELPNGYGFRLPTDSTIFLKAAEFIANERLCCPFFEFSLTVTPNGGPIWLQLAGSADVKAFVKAEFSSLVAMP